jgi:hypothetical protein
MSFIETEKKDKQCTKEVICPEFPAFPTKKDTKEEKIRPDGSDGIFPPILSSGVSKPHKAPKTIEEKPKKAPLDASSQSSVSSTNGALPKPAKGRPVKANKKPKKTPSDDSSVSSDSSLHGVMPKQAKGRPVKANNKPKKAPSDDSSVSSDSFHHGAMPKPIKLKNKKKQSNLLHPDASGELTKPDVPPVVTLQNDDCVSKPPPNEGTTPMKMKEKQLSLEHYKNFVKKAYSVLIPKDCFDKLTIDNLVLNAVSNKLTSKSLTPKQLKKRIHIIKNWETGANGLDMKNFRKKNRIGYRFIKSQHYVKANQDGQLFLYNVKNQVYVNVLQVFDLIAECHSQVGCLKTASTKNAVDIKYANISREEVQAFVQTCKYCSHDHVAKKRVSGAIKPIISLNFRERFQVDLIDYREDEQVDVYGHKMRWLLVLKDHLTRLCYLKPIPNKKSNYVAHELYHIFGLIGHPLVLQSDNGKEFTGSALLDMLYELDPGITTVYGRPRTPRDQGSVERLNQTVKRIIAKQVMKMNDAFPEKKHSWISVYPLAMSAMNAAKTSRGQYDASPYESVFGLQFHEPLLKTATIKQLRENKTVESSVSPGILRTVPAKKLESQFFCAAIFWIGSELSGVSES